MILKDKNNANGDIEISISGLRAGEKLFEELLIGDNPKKTNHKTSITQPQVSTILKSL